MGKERKRERERWNGRGQTIRDDTLGRIGGFGRKTDTLERKHDEAGSYNKDL